jgi:peptidoglycan/xylan/chitin deacetylase (PgdA/CDA1 family)
MRLDRFITLNLVHPFRRALGSFRSLNSQNPVLHSRTAKDGSTLNSKWAVPILMYHSISNDPEPGVSPYYKVNTSPAVFRQHIQFLADQGYTTITMAQLVEILRTPHSVNSQSLVLRSRIAEDGSTLNSQLVAITFDDGFRNFYTEAFPVLQQHGFTATVFLPTAFIGDTRRVFAPRSNQPSTINHQPSTNLECLTWPEVRELRKAGIEFGSHTVTHPQLLELPWPQVEFEIHNSKLEIEMQLSEPITAFCYPYAYPQANRSFTKVFTTLLAEADYTCCATTQLGRVESRADPHHLRRLPANSLDDVALLHAKLDGAYDWLALPQAVIKRLKSLTANFSRQDDLVIQAAPSAMN